MNAQFRLVNQSSAPRADIAFVVDSSGSMQDEWDAICGIISEIQINLSEAGIDCEFYTIEPDHPAITIKCPVMNPQPNIVRFAQQQNLPLYDSVNKDQSNEAWATASIWAIKNLDWRDGSAKIIFPVSDSDPTGLWLDLYNPINPPYFSGSEQPNVDRLISEANNKQIHVFPVYGDTDLLRPEGYGIGCSGGCCPGATPECNQIISMMHEIADQTGGNVTGYTDEDSLLNFILNALVTYTPKDVNIDVGSVTLFNQSTEINTSILINFTQQLKDFIGNCTSDSDGYCTYEMSISSTGSGVLLLYDLDVEITPYLNSLQFNLSDMILKQYNTSMNISDTIDFLGALNWYYGPGACHSDKCKVPFTLSGNVAVGQYALNLSDLLIEYYSYPVPEVLAQSILDCWNQANFGQSISSIACEQFTIPQEYTLFDLLTEKEITNIIIKRNLCQLMPNNRDDLTNDALNCSDQDRLGFAKQVTEADRRLLIEYNAEQKKVIVS